MNNASLSPLARRVAEAELERFTATTHFHPLELFAVFRRWPRSFLRNLIYTLILNAMFALAFTLLAFVFHDPGRLWRQLPALVGDNLIIANVVGFAFWGVLELIGPLLRKLHRHSFWAIAFVYTLIGTVIVTVSMYVVSFVPGTSGMRQWLGTPSQLVSGLVVSFAISLVLSIIWQRRADELAAQIALAEERERAEAAERAASQASLRVLQAQIEPHFLFNTLANVTGLIKTQPDKAKQMLEQFISYLRATLASTREQNTTLGAEFGLIATYLSVMRVRLEGRLSVRIELPAELAEIAVPPMLFQPLVENAIKHGIEPKIEGGEVLLSARRVGEQVAITVSDTGVGFQHSSTDGFGLKNVRERVHQLFGDAGSVSVEAHPPSGTRVTVTFPCDPA
jgi:sensor histidine kinase YesM